MKKMIEVDLKWFCFNQNNSGGRFVIDENVAPVVFIQARGVLNDADMATLQEQYEMAWKA